MTICRRQLPSTLIVQPVDTPVILILLTVQPVDTPVILIIFTVMRGQLMKKRV